MRRRCGSLTKKGTKCKRRVRPGQKCHHHAQKELLSTCSICLCGIGGREGGEEKQLTVCGHRFHEDCIRQWFVRCSDRDDALTCPLCRSEETDPLIVAWVDVDNDDDDDEEWLPSNLWRDIVSRMARNSARRQRVVTQMRTLYDLLQT